MATREALTYLPYTGYPPAYKFNMRQILAEVNASTNSCTQTPDVHRNWVRNWDLPRV